MKSKIFTLNFILFPLVFKVASPLKAMNYQVDQNNFIANDQNTGTVERPWKTITKANQTLTAGDAVYIRAGTNTSYIAPANSGTSPARITYKNYFLSPCTFNLDP